MFIKARVDGAIRKHPELATIYEQIRKGTIRGLSFGGLLKRIGNNIIDIDVTELSAGAIPTHAAPRFDVVEGKALELALIEDELDGLRWLRDRLQERDRQLKDVRYKCARISLGMRSRCFRDG